MTFWSRNLNRQVQLKLAFNHAAGTRPCTLDVFRKLAIVKLGDSFGERLFHLLSNGKTELSCEDFVTGVMGGSDLDFEQSINLLFTLYDRGNAGSLDIAEVQDLIEDACVVSKIDFKDGDLLKWATLLVGAGGKLDRNSLKTLLENNHQSKFRLSLVDMFLKTEAGSDSETYSYRFLQSGYYRHNYRSVAVLILFIGLFTALGVQRFFSESAIHSDPDIRLNSTTEQEIGSCTVHNHLKGLHSGWELVAKIFGQILNALCAFVLVMVLRLIFTQMRRIGLNRVLPLDHNIYFHKVLGYAITVCGLVHTVFHIANVLVLARTHRDRVCLLFTPGYRGVNFASVPPFITGWLLVLVLAILVIFSVPAIRRSGYFQLFYNTHRLYVAFFALLILHGPSFWKWLAAPGILYCGEVFFRLTGLLRKFGKTQVLRAELFDGNTVELRIAKPDDFDFRCGDFLYLNVPSVSKYEWHAFTISSAPELDYLTVHIRAVGEWTRHVQELIRRLYDDKRRQSALNKAITVDQAIPRRLPARRHTIIFSKPGLGSPGTPTVQAFTTIEMNASIDKVTLRSRPMNARSAAKSISRMSTVRPLFRKYSRPDPTKRMSTVSQQGDIVVEGEFLVNVDGPYGAPASDFLHSPHPVLIAAGIGVTPFMSILQSIVHRYIAMKTQCPHCSRDIIAAPPKSLENLRKIDSIWIVRNFEWVTWFKGVFRELVHNQGEYGEVLKKLIRIRIFVTSPDEQVTAANVLLKIALEKVNAVKNANLHQLRSDVQLGRPDWDRILGEIAAEDSEATVFFCGPAPLAKSLRKTCLQHKLDFRKETF